MSTTNPETEQPEQPAADPEQPAEQPQPEPAEGDQPQGPSEDDEA